MSGNGGGNVWIDNSLASKDSNKRAPSLGSDNMKTGSAESLQHDRASNGSHKSSSDRYYDLDIEEIDIFTHIHSFIPEIFNG
jgi:hypothetical protein